MRIQKTSLKPSIAKFGKVHFFEFITTSDAVALLDIHPLDRGDCGVVDKSLFTDHSDTCGQLDVAGCIIPAHEGICLDDHTGHLLTIEVVKLPVFVTYKLEITSVGIVILFGGGNLR